MKKILYFFGIFGVILSLTSCNLVFGTPSETANTIEQDKTVYEIQNQITDVYEKVSSACVGIYTSLGSTSYATGSGVIYKMENSEYYVITNHHVIEDGLSYKVYLGGTKYYTGTLIGSDSTNDIAVLKFSTDILGGVSITPIDISQTDIVKPGQTAIAIGCPLGLENFNHISTGVVTGVTTRYVQTDAALNSGNSGGGLFNISGRLIGINVSKTSWNYNSDGTIDSDVVVEGFGNAISMSIVRKAVSDIEEKQTTIARPLLGITAGTVNRYTSSKEIVAYMPDTLEQAVIVSSVSHNSNASKAGLKEYDVIYMVGETAITKLEDLQYILYVSNIGDVIELKVYRTNSNNQIETITLSVTLNK